MSKIALASFIYLFSLLFAPSDKSLIVWVIQAMITVRLHSPCLKNWLMIRIKCNAICYHRVLHIEINNFHLILSRFLASNLITRNPTINIILCLVLWIVIEKINKNIILVHRRLSHNKALFCVLMRTVKKSASDHCIVVQYTRLWKITIQSAIRQLIKFSMQHLITDRHGNG